MNKTKFCKIFANSARVSSADMSANDSRFAGVSTDPRFRRAPRSERKIVLDERFSKMLTDERFLVSEHRDPRGRPFTKSHREDLARYFSPEDKLPSGDHSEQLSDSRGQFTTEHQKDEEEDTDNDEQNESEEEHSESSAESDESDDAVDEDELRAATG